jgi:predicted TPR repeat methyltransferase
MLKPLSLSQAFSEAMAAWENGNPSEARRLARQIIDANPNFGGAHYLLGIISLGQGQARKAVEHLSRAVAADPAQTVPRLALGRALDAQNSIHAAIVQYRAILGADPSHAEANARLGELLARTGKSDEAVACCRKALAVHPRHTEALCTLGGLLHGLGHEAEAASYLEQALALRPDWPQALHNYGLVLRALGRTDQAATILAGAVELRPDFAASRAALAGALRDLGRLDEARVQAERATKLQASDPGGWLELGLVRRALGSEEGAAAAFERAAGADAKSAAAQWCLAESRRLLGQSDRAERHYRRCLELDPDDRHGAALGLAQLGVEPTPDKAPDAYVRQLFDDYAETFDAALVDKLGYRAPEILAQALGRVLVRKTGLDVLDAGCGTGLAAPVLRPLARTLDGVDLAPAMVDKARARAVYDHLEAGDLVACMAARPLGWDLIVAADVLVYMGDLRPVLAAAHEALKPKGLFAFTVERSDDCTTYLLGAKNRYTHAIAHVEDLAHSLGFTVALSDCAVTRQESGQDVPGQVMVLRKE